MAELHLFPDERVVIQAAVYVVGLAAAHFFLVKPLLGLQKERHRRTSAASDGAAVDEDRIFALEKEYDSRIGLATADAKEMRNKDILSGQAEAEDILRSAKSKAKQQIELVRKAVDEQVLEQRQRLPQYSQELAGSILKKVSGSVVQGALLFWIGFALVSAGLSGICGWVGSGSFALAAGGAAGAVDFWDGTFWPLFQFSLFVIGFWYFGRGALAKMLEKKRDALRTQLSEAKQAVHAAEGKIAAYEAKMARLESDLADLRRSYVSEGVKQREDLIEEARHLRIQILKDAELRTNEIVSTARESMRWELIEQAMGAAEGQLKGDLLVQVDRHLQSRAVEVLQKIHLPA